MPSTSSHAPVLREISGVGCQLITDRWRLVVFPPYTCANPSLQTHRWSIGPHHQQSDVGDPVRVKRSHHTLRHCNPSLHVELVRRTSGTLSLRYAQLQSRVTAHRGLALSEVCEERGFRRRRMRVGRGSHVDRRILGELLSTVGRTVHGQEGRSNR